MGGARAPVTKQEPAAAGVQVQTSALGRSIPLLYGRVRVTGNLLWLGNFKYLIIKNGDVYEAAFGGAGVPTSLKYLYYVSAMLALGEGPITDILAVYRESEMLALYGGTDTDGQVEVESAGGMSFLYGWLFRGLADQPVWDDDSLHSVTTEITQSFPRPATQLAYSRIAYVAKHRWVLKNQASLPSYAFELVGLLPFTTVLDGRDNPIGCDPADVLRDMLADPFHGAGFPAGRITGLQHYSDYALASEFLLSPALIEPKPAHEYVGDLLRQSNTEVIWSQGLLRPVPRGDTALVNTRTEATYTPAHVEDDGTGQDVIIARYALDEDDFIVDSPDDDAIVTEREDISDSPNVITVEYANRGTDYHATTISFLAADQSINDSASGLPELEVGQFVSVAGASYTPNNTAIGGVERKWQVVSSTASKMTVARTWGLVGGVNYSRIGDETAGSEIKLTVSGRYETSVVEHKDDALIALYGEHASDTIEAHGITDGPTARRLAALEAQRAPEKRCTYTFRLDWRYALLEPLADIVTLTHTRQGFAAEPVVPLTIEEGDDGTLTVTARPLLLGLNTVVQYAHQDRRPTIPDVDADPGGINPPVLFEPTAKLSGNAFELWMGVSGTKAAWGGCKIYLSEDEGVTWENVGQITENARLGTLTGAIASGGSSVTLMDGRTVTKDTVGHINVQLRATGEPRSEQLEEFSAAEAQRYKSACVVGAGTDPTAFTKFEVLSYEEALLIGTRKYQLGTLYRGAYDMPNQGHQTGGYFLRLDDAVFKLALQPRHINTTLRFKFLSFNVFGSEQDQLEDVEAVHYTVSGALYRAPLASVTRLRVAYQPPKGMILLRWEPLRDFRRIEYEIRRASTSKAVDIESMWRQATIIGAVSDTRFAVSGDGTYMVAPRTGTFPAAPDAALVGLPQVYGEPEAVTVSGAWSLADNVVVTHDEVPLQFSDYVSMVEAQSPAMYHRFSELPVAEPAVYDEIAGAVFSGAAYTGGTFGAAGAIVNHPDSCWENDGTEWVSLGSGAANDLPGSWSMSMWVKTSDAVNPYLFYAKATGDWFGIDAGYLVFQADGASPVIQLAAPLIADDTWHFLVLSYVTSGGRLRFYVDGELAHTERDVVISVTTGATLIGNVNGYFDEFALFPHPWGAATRARAHYRAGTDASYECGTYSAYVRDFGARYHLRLGERPANVLFDDTTNANDATLVPDAATGPQDATGLLSGDDDHARYFDGINDKITVTTSSSLDVASAATIMAVVNLPDIGRDNYVLAFLTGGLWLDFGPYLVVTNGGFLRCNFKASDGTDNLLTTASAVITAGQTHHIAATFTGSIARLFVDGERVAQQTFSPSFSLKTSGLDVVLGLGPGVYMRGTVDEVSIHGAALTQSQVGYLADAALTAHTTTLSVTAEGYLEAAPSSSGTFQAPDAHVVTLGREEFVNVAASWTVVAVNDGYSATAGAHIADMVSDPDSSAQADADDLAQFVEGYPEIDISQDGVTWLGWQQLDPEGHRGMAFRLRFHLASLRDGIRAQLREFSWTVDMPDVRKYGTEVLSSGAGAATQVTFARPFEGVPSIQTTILDAQAGDWVLVTDIATTGFKVDVFDSSPARVTRTVSWVALGY